MNTIAIVSARGGSKRIPEKNIRAFCGQPIVGNSIEAAFDSGVFDEVIVSTDDEQNANISWKNGTTVSGLRPLEFSNDATGVMAVLA